MFLIWYIFTVVFNMSAIHYLNDTVFFLVINQGFEAYQWLVSYHAETKSGTYSHVSLESTHIINEALNQMLVFKPLVYMFMICI